MDAKERLDEILRAGIAAALTPGDIADRIASEGLLAAEQTNADDEPSPINACIRCGKEVGNNVFSICDSCQDADKDPRAACIRAAKRVIAALNLPEGAGIYWTSRCWYVSSEEPNLENPRRLFKSRRPEFYFPLPPTAIAEWPGDFRESWITATTPEIPDETNKE